MIPMNGKSQYKTQAIRELFNIDYFSLCLVYSICGSDVQGIISVGKKSPYYTTPCFEITIDSLKTKADHDICHRKWECLLKRMHNIHPTRPCHQE